MARQPKKRIQTFAGITPGGLTDVYEIKILICYLLDSIRKPVDQDTLNNIITYDNLVSFLDYSVALSELIDFGNLSLERQEDGSECFVLTDLGQETSRTLRKHVPIAIRERITATALNVLAQMKREREISIETVPVKDGLIVKLAIHDIGSDLMRFELLVPDQEQADIVIRKIKKDPAAFYRNTVEYLVL